MKKFIKIVSIICIIIILIFTFLFFYIFRDGVLCNMPWNKKKATDAAKEYLSEKYVQEIQHIKTDFPLINFFSSIYTVYFAPFDKPDLIFQVMVSVDFQVPEIRPVYDESDMHWSYDSYFHAYFKYYASKYFQSFADKLWGSDVLVLAYAEHSGPYTFKMPNNINEQMTVKEMAGCLNFDISFSIDQILNETTKKEEAQRILEMLTTIKKSGYEPDNIRFWYKTGLKDEKSKISEGTRSEDYIEMKNWAVILTIDEIINEFDKQWKY